jgi:hypothetical protein
LGTLGVDFDAKVNDLNMNLEAAEKYIVSLKLQRYLEKLNTQKQELTNKLLAGDETARDEITEINSEIKKYSEKLNLLFRL